MWDRKYYIMFKKIYSDRFSTDCFSGFYSKKVSKASIGLPDLPEYSTTKASFEELLQQNSYFINDLNKCMVSEEKDEKRRNEISKGK